MEGMAMPRPPFVRKSHRRVEEDYVHSLLDEGDLEGLAEFVNEQAGTLVVEAVQAGIRWIPGSAKTDLDEFRRLVREDPGGALDLVRGPPLAGVDASWAVPLRAQVQAEIVAAAHAACRLDSTNAAEYVRKGLVGAPGDASLWIALLGVAGKAKSIRAVDMVYESARDTYATVARAPSRRRSRTSTRSGSENSVPGEPSALARIPPSGAIWRS
jgi:hypothetical protein